jgi:glycosyltransferase involved in cell wall biosynthesis
VDDGSNDETWETISRLSQDRPWLRGVRLMRNYGQHNALLCGIRSARHEIIVTMDDDLQNPPEEVPRLLMRLAEGFDVVYGKPTHERHGIWRDMASLLTKIFLRNIMGAQTARDVSAFRAFRTPLRSAFASYQAPYVSIDVLLTWATRKFTAVTVQHEPRTVGQSSYSFMKLVNIALTLMTGFTVLPLRVASIAGFLCTLLGFGLFAYVIERYLVAGRAVPGFAFLASAVTFLSGVELFALGVIGEYLARMHFRMMDRPAYVVAESVSAGAGLAGSEFASQPRPEY